LGLAWLLGPGVWVMLDPGIDLKKTYTTRLHSFTDGNILLVCDLEFIGNFFTDEKRSSAFLSSVIPNSIAKSVGKKKQLPMVLQTKIVRQKKNSRLKYTDGLIPSVIVAYPVNILQLPIKCQWTISLSKVIGECVKYRHNLSVCKCIGDCGICTKLL
jgi:hypothetical protein